MARKGRNNRTSPEIVAKRQEIVAALTLRHCTQREIVAIMSAAPKPGMDGRFFFLNPETNEPWGLTTINNDIKAIRTHWQAEAQRSFGERQADLLAEIKEVRKRGWQKDEMGVVARSLDQETALFGLNGPVKVAPTNPSGDEQYNPADAGMGQVLDRLLPFLAKATAAGVFEQPAGTDEGSSPGGVRREAEAAVDAVAEQPAGASLLQPGG